MRVFEREKGAVVTRRTARSEVIGATRTLAGLLLVLVLGAMTETPAFSATDFHGPVATVGHRTAHGPSCGAVKGFKTGGTSLRFPSCWALSTYKDETTMSSVLAFFSNQPTQQPCVTTSSGATITVRCGFPLKSLNPGGVLVMFIAGGRPGWTIGKEPGRRFVIDRHAARETIAHGSHLPLQATGEYSIFIDRGVADNYYQLEVFFRNPGVGSDQRLLQRMLKSMRIK